MLRKIIPYILILAGFSQCSHPDIIPLSGTWNYKLDNDNVGETERWYAEWMVNPIPLPGALRDNGIGDVPSLQTRWTGSIYDSSWFFRPEMEKYREADPPKFPFWLTPGKRYVGAAWYQKEIVIPARWKDKSITLFLERPHWQTTVWLDTLLLGSRNSLSTPHVFSLDSLPVKPGRHIITVRVDNAIRDIDPGINSHSITDHSQGNWNGMVGDMYLTARSRCHIGPVKISPDPGRKLVDINLQIKNIELAKNIRLSIRVKGLHHSHTPNPLILSGEAIRSEMNIQYPMGDQFKTWSEFSPDLYEMTLILDNNHGKKDIRKEIFGMREFSINGKHFEINGIPVFLRGTTECCVFPLTGYPPTEVDAWARIFRICKAYGLNHMRFHSWCPPEAAFLAADEAGIYLQVEGPSWAKHSVTLGDGKPIDRYLMEETKRIIDSYGNHPSFCMMSYGNEPSGHYVPYLENWVDHFREYDPQRVFTGASTGKHWKIIENSDYIVRASPRGLEWEDSPPESCFDYRNKTENQDRPYVTFEMGQWCVFPDFKEIDKYTGPLKARNFELFQENLHDKDMADQAQDFLMASGKLQVLCYKQEIEAALRTPNLAGFQLLSLNDFPGQGTALVGVLNAFWDEKGYISAEEFGTFCNRVVPLIRVAKYTYTNLENLKADVELTNFSGAELTQLHSSWQLRDEQNRILRSGTFIVRDIPPGNGHELGSIDLPLNFIEKAGKFTLVVQAGNDSNQWNLWIYPDTDFQKPSSEIHSYKTLNAEVKKALHKGEKVLLLAAGSIEHGKEIVQYFTPVFWNTSWYRMRPPHTTGILIQEDHPVFEDFPTDYHSDMQWWALSNKQQVMNLADFPPDFRPIVQPIDTWFLNRRLAMLFEARVDSGKIVVCSMDLLDPGVVRKQLYNSIIKYMESDSFQPQYPLEWETLEELFVSKSPKEDL